MRQKREIGFKIRRLAVNPFKMHLSDAILAAHLCTEKEKHYPEIVRLFARTSVVHSVFAVECAANCCIDALPQGSKFKNKAEMWPVVEKFELYLMTRPGAPLLPRGDDRIQRLNQLIKARDKHVHSRTQNYETSDPRSGGDFRVNIDLKQNPVLVPEAFVWGPEEATAALKAAVDFMRFYFIDVCKHSPEETGSLLSTFLYCDDGKRAADVGKFNRLLKLAPTVGVDLSFLG